MRGEETRRSNRRRSGREIKERSRRDQPEINQTVAVVATQTATQERQELQRRHLVFNCVLCNLGCDKWYWYGL